MSDSSLKLESSVVVFYVFNPKLGPKEGEEHKKILWYYPQSHHADVQTRNIGFCEAIVRFAGLFSDKRSLSHSAVMDGRLDVYYEPEPDYFLGMSVEVKDEKKVHENVYKSMLEFAYKMFRLFFGTFSDGSQFGRDFGRLRKRLDFFYSRYVTGMTVSPVPLLDIFSGIYFTPLDKVNYLKIQTLIGRLLETFTQIRHSVFLFNNKLLWYSIPRDDMCVLYRYLANNLLPAFMRQELEPTTTKTSVHHFGKFLTGPPNLLDPTDLGKIPGIYIRKEQVHLSGGSFSEACEGTEIELDRYQLIIYRSLNATFCLLVDDDAQLDFEFFKSIDLFLGPQLSSISTGISRFSGIGFG